MLSDWGLYLSDSKCAYFKWYIQFLPPFFFIYKESKQYDDKWSNTLIY